MEVESTNQVIFNYLRERLIEGKEIIYKKDLLDAYNNRLSLEVESVTDVRPIIEKILKEFENISLQKKPMENNSFTKKTHQKVKSSYITSRNFSNLRENRKDWESQ